MPYHRSFKSRIFRKFLKFLLVLMILAMVALLGWRIILSSFIPSDMKGISSNNKLLEVYQGKDSIHPFTQEYSEFTFNEEAYGYFSVISAIFIPEAEQLQIVVRYNKSTLEKIATDFSLDSVPDRDEQVFDITVVQTTVDSGEQSEIRYFSENEQTYQNSLYNYIKLTFNDISVTDITEGVFVDFYYVGNLDYNNSSIGSVCIYDCESENNSYQLTTRDIKNLSGE